MKVISEETEAAWKSPAKIGDRRPVVRATVQAAFMRKTAYNTADAPGGDYDHERSRQGNFTSFLFGGDEGIREVRNLRRYSWSRSVERDVSEATMTILNTDVTPIGNAQEQSDDFELPGLMAYNRGVDTVEPNRWGYHDETGWTDIQVPDRLVKTYEGYGCDDTLAPGDDPNLYMSGTWIIDEVSYNAEGDIEITMSDFGRLLIDHIAFPPIIPWDDYPLAWGTIGSEKVEGRAPTGGSWKTLPGTATSSNQAYVGKNIQDTPKYVGSFGGVQGHNENDPITGDPNDDYWLSTGQEGPDNFVWWEQEFDFPQNMAGIRIQTVGGPYRIYVSLQREDGHWYGKRKVPYQVGEATEGVDIDAKKFFVHTERAEKGEPFDIVFKKAYANVRRVRITFTRLRRTTAARYPWRAGLRKMLVYAANDFASLGFDPSGEVLKPVGNYRDYTDIVKWVCAWAGLYWPAGGQANYVKYSTAGDKVHYEYAAGDSILPKGRVWGSFQNTGTAGVADLGAENFDKQPLMDVVNYVREITGFSFWFDEAGGAVWRLPNLYSKGNYVTPHHKQTRRGPQRTTDFVTIDEEETLIEYETRLSSRNLRERIFVGDSMGKHGTVIRGYTPVRAGFRRVAGWTDQNFRTNREMKVAADMIAARQMFDWRRSKIVTYGNPAIQVDDQVRVFERVTNESFFHYVLGLSCELDNEAGTWTYTLETHWLGERPSDAWAVRVDQLDGATKAYIDSLGAVD